jgi:glycogen debranching enzyme
LLEAAGERKRSDTLRNSAHALRRRVEERYWMDEEGCYAFALDGRKKLVRSISSNPGHLLWCGLPSQERARKVAARLLAPDMFSGYGVRTLQSEHACYNPLSYQLGSVWPHDNALIAAGLMRYGLREEAARVLEGMLSAAANFEHNRLPELFCGLSRDEGPPVPYEKANVPQAWAAAAPLLAAQLFVGLLPDAPNGRCYVDPWLPEWLPSIEIDGIELAGGTLRVAIRREGAETRITASQHPSLEIVEQMPAAPLWGAPSGGR